MKKRCLSLLLCVSLLLGISVSALSGCAKTGETPLFENLVGTPTDYSKAENWMLCPDTPEYDADVIFLYPSAYVNPDDGYIGTVDDETMHKNAADAYGQMGSAFEGTANVFVPYYRQINIFKLASMTADEIGAYLLKEPRTDIYAMLDYYFENLNNGRPFILAGHSQGSNMLSLILDEYMEKHPEYYSRMVCAYMLGFSLTSAMLADNPHLHAAQGETDTGVIVSWNTESPANADIGETLIVQKGAVCINPLNWKTDGTYAGVSLNRGSLVQGADGSYAVGDGIADAQINLTRGTLVCANVDHTPYAFPEGDAMFGAGSFHGQDYSFYYINIRENAIKRIAIYLGTDLPDAQPVSTGAVLDLTNMYADAAAFDTELERVNTVQLAEYEKRVRAVSDDAAGVLEWLRAYEELSTVCAKMYDYAICAYYRDFSDSTAKSQYNAVNDLYGQFDLLTTAAKNALISKGDAFFDELLGNDALQPWYTMLASIRDSAPYTLSEADETLTLPAQRAMSQLESLDSTLLDSDLQYRTFTDADGNETAANYTNFSISQSSTDRDLRMRARNAFVGSLSDYSETFSGIFDIFFKLAENNSEIHHFENSLDEAMLGCGLTTEDFTALVDSAQAHADLEARYNALRKKALGVDELYGWDINTPICETPDIVYSFTDAKELILSALAPLGDEYIACLNEIFDEGRIDADPGDDKYAGAFSTMGYAVSSKILMNFSGDYDSVSTLAHELGHAVHNMYMNKYQESSFNCSATLIETEVASTTNELLLARYMQEHAATEEEKLYYLLYEANIMSLNYFTGIARASFEYDMHEIIRDGGTLSAGTMNKAYYETFQKFSPGVKSTDGLNPGWTYVTQYFTPYYNIDYSFAVAASCAAVLGITDGSGVADYQSYLSSGCSMPTDDLFALLGAQLGTEEYPQALYDRYSEILDIAESIIG